MGQTTTVSHTHQPPTHALVSPLSQNNAGGSTSGGEEDDKGLSPAEAGLVDASYLLQVGCALLLMLAMLHAGWQVRCEGIE